MRAGAPMGMNGGMVDAHVGSTLQFQVEQTAEVHLMIAVCPRPGVTVDEVFDVRLDDAPVRVRPVAGGHHLTAGPGLLHIDYTAAVTVRRGAPERLDLGQRIAATRPSRY